MVSDNTESATEEQVKKNFSDIAGSVIGNFASAVVGSYRESLRNKSKGDKK